MKSWLCPFPGCLAIVPMQGHYCARHAHLQADKDRRAREYATARWDKHHATTDYSWVWHDPRWRKLRAAQLKREPDCRRCGTKATTVDHVIPHRGDVALAFDPLNLQSLCSRCSAIKTREDRDRPNPYPPSKKQESR